MTIIGEILVTKCRDQQGREERVKSWENWDELLIFMIY